jgi:TPP-dependent pyruvate/acetoin dehydrogenase alpha subunit
MMAELFGRKAGYCKGKGGSMHIADPEIGILGANGIVGAGITIANGAALATQLDRTDQITICFFGDGACNTTRFHEGINLASIWNLPVIYVIENNMYAETTHVSRVCKLANLAERAYAYGIPGETVDGNDVLAVYEAVSKRVRRARRGKGASIIECKTCRWHGHDEGDQQTYRTKEEITECKKRDPILRFKRQLLEKGILTEHKIEQINREINDEIEKAVEFALESPFPAPEETLEDVYA